MTDFCPVCGGSESGAVTHSASFRRCCFCRTVFNTSHRTIEYSDSYFTTDYTAQYGRTYEEDFAAIYKAAQLRLKRIRSLWTLETPPATILDIGCALGFFLKAAQDDGFTSLNGIEISAYASNYCRKKFGYSIQQTPFESADMSGSYDIISAWYFLEHLTSTGRALEKIYDALKPGGIAALSMPSVFGPLFAFHRDEWVATHPVDHHVDLSPRGAVIAFKDAGFRKVKVFPSGIHPERMLRRESLLYPVLEKGYIAFSKATGFSDTIEIYAVK